MTKKIYFLLALSTAAFGMQIAGPSSIPVKELVKRTAKETMVQIVDEAESFDNFKTCPRAEGLRYLARLTQQTLVLARCAQEGTVPHGSFYYYCGDIRPHLGDIVRRMILFHTVDLLSYSGAPVQDCDHAFSGIICKDLHSSDWRDFLDQRVPKVFDGSLEGYFVSKFMPVAPDDAAPAA